MNCVKETKKPNRKILIIKEGDSMLKTTLFTDLDIAEERFPLKEK
jgi:hypothetical protein